MQDLRFSVADSSCKVCPSGVYCRNWGGELENSGPIENPSLDQGAPCETFNFIFAPVMAMRGSLCRACTSIAPRGRAQDHVGAYPQADIEYGSRIFAAQCTSCHGMSGDQVAGVNLRSGQFKHVFSDSDLRAVITNGIAGTAMPPHTFNPAELAAVVAYIRNMATFDARNVSLGDAKRGEAIFNGAGNCGSCRSRQRQRSSRRSRPEQCRLCGRRARCLLVETSLTRAPQCCRSTVRCAR